ncbi:MAG: hypothetical protein HN855_15110 [Anaerolineae bacterium]|jgi:hypothetical protein|nr:hypothetical protein [Anaerolineae bacterium]MBT7071878.1 hypothetical protein [Anaerolineae bacterium]MBT7326484.1 hypothetical protein [Anaerolineae bacterium]
MKIEKKVPARQYPPLYEKVVPIMLFLLVVIVIGVLIIAFGVVLGLVA